MSWVGFNFGYALGLLVAAAFVAVIGHVTPADAAILAAGLTVSGLLALCLAFNRFNKERKTPPPTEQQ